MVNPWEGPRHRSWLSDTYITAALFVLVLAATVLVDALNGPNEGAPAYLTGLLGAAGAALFNAAGTDREKRDADTENTAARAERRTLSLNEDIIRTERKTDKLAKFAREQHPAAPDVPDPLIPHHVRNDDEADTGEAP